jgi:predicted ferric reductase
MQTGTPDRVAASARILMAFAYVIIVFLLLIAMVIYSEWSKQDVFVKAGTGLILVVLPILALQPVLAARLKLLDRCFGLDIIYIFHKSMGILAGMLLICASVFLIAGPVRFLPWTCIVGATLILFLVSSALIHKELHLTYEGWRTLHNVLFIASFPVVLSLAWLMVISMDNLPAEIIVAVLILTTLTSYVFHKFINPFHRKKHLYRIVSVTRETKNVWTLIFKPPEGDTRFACLPGQFQFLTFDAGNGEEHPFTISSSPTQESYHAASIKESGDFTSGIGSKKIGDLIAIQAPFGRFSYVLHPAEHDLVFIAGGIGITPFMSMLRHMRDTASDMEVLLLYANRTEEDIVFRNELDSFSSQSHPRLHLVHVLSKAGDTWSGERGHINRALIEKQFIGDLRDKTFYLCGPPSMMTVTMSILLDLGIPSHRIRSERFAL